MFVRFLCWRCMLFVVGWDALLLALGSFYYAVYLISLSLSTPAVCVCVCVCVMDLFLFLLSVVPSTLWTSLLFLSPRTAMALHSLPTFHFPRLGKMIRSFVAFFLFSLFLSRGGPGVLSSCPSCQILVCVFFCVFTLPSLLFSLFPPFLPCEFLLRLAAV